MTDDEIMELAQKVTNDFDGVSYLVHDEEAWVIDFAKRLMEIWTKEKQNEQG